jgi:hypothetical protein
VQTQQQAAKGVTVATTVQAEAVVVQAVMVTLLVLVEMVVMVYV